MLAKGLGSAAREGRGKGDFPLPGGGVIPFPAPPLPKDVGGTRTSHTPKTPPQQMNLMDYILRYVRANGNEKRAKVSRGARMYVMKAELVQRPSAWMVESGIPASAAAVAAPIRKL